MESSFEREIAFVVDNLLNGGGSHQEAIELMNTLRKQAQRIDAHLANPNNRWNVFEQRSDGSET